MANKESVETFLRNIPNWPSAIQRLAVGEFNKQSLVAMNESKRLSPLRQGTLRRSARLIRAVVTDKGIEAKYIFGVDYALPFETGERVPSTRKNPDATVGFGKKGAEFVAEDLMEAMKKIVSESFGVI